MKCLAQGLAVDCTQRVRSLYFAPSKADTLSVSSAQVRGHLSRGHANREQKPFLEHMLCARPVRI